MSPRSLFLLASLAAGAFAAAPASADPGKATRNVNLRECASPRCRLILTIPAGATFEVIDRQGAWYEVEYRGRSGFAFARYIALGRYYEEPAPPVYEPYEYDPFDDPFYDPFPNRHRRHHRPHHDDGDHGHGHGGGNDDGGPPPPPPPPDDDLPPLQPPPPFDGGDQPPPPPDAGGPIGGGPDIPPPDVGNPDQPGPMLPEDGGPRDGGADGGGFGSGGGAGSGGGNCDPDQPVCQ